MALQLMEKVFAKYGLLQTKSGKNNSLKKNAFLNF